MNEKTSKNNVFIPEKYWKAFCYYTESKTEDIKTHAWVYVQVNQNNQDHSSGNNFMSPKAFSKK